MMHKQTINEYNNTNGAIYHDANLWSQQQQNFEKQTHPEWGIMKKEEDFHPLTLKHQRDLENLHQANNFIVDFYFWQANLGGYCMADMVQKVVISPDGAYPLVRRIVDGAPHPGRRKKRKL